MKILVASDKFKGSLTAPEACAAIREGLLRGWPRTPAGQSGQPAPEIRCLPVADGGDGMARALTRVMGGQWRESEVTGPLGAPLAAGWGLVETGGAQGENPEALRSTALVEMAEASGLWRLGGRPNDPWRATTFGTGQLVAEALRAGADRILLGLGGSATNDGGSGLARALGFRFLDAAGHELADLPADLEKAARIEPPEAPLSAEITVACDVANPLLGPQGCTSVYGPQKGIAPGNIARHESRLAHLVDLLGEKGCRAAEAPGTGAAGGLGFGCLAFLGAKLKPGFELVAEVLGLEEAIARADLVVTGEGKLDAQSLEGKAPVGVARLAKSRGKPVHAFCGLLEGAESAGSGRLSGCFDSVHEIERGDRSIEESMAEGAALLAETAARRVAEVLQ